MIVCDDASTDSTPLIIQDFASRYPNLRPILRRNNVGALANFRMAHDEAVGEFVCHCDGDDLLYPSKLETQHAFMARSPEYTASWHRVDYFDDFGNLFPGCDYDYSMFHDGEVSFEDALRFGPFATNSSIMSRRSARGCYRPEFPVMDIFYMWEFLSQGRGKLIDDVLGAYRVNAVNAITRNSGNTLKALYAVYGNYFLNHFPRHRKYIFLFAVTNFLADLKNFRNTSGNFAKLALRSVPYIGPGELFSHLLDARTLRIPQLRPKAVVRTPDADPTA